VTHWRMLIGMLHAPVCQIWVVRKKHQKRQTTITFSLNKHEQMSLTALNVYQYWGERKRERKEGGRKANVGKKLGLRKEE